MDHPTTSDFARLELMFRRASTLPPIPHQALRLVREIDEGESSARDLERTIVGDPALATEFLRVAAGYSLGRQPEATSIRQVILLLGQRAVRSIGCSLLVRASVLGAPREGGIDPEAFGRECLAIGMVARYLYARNIQQNGPTSTWSCEDVFAAGLTIQFPVILLQRVDPSAFNRVRTLAVRKKLPFESAFAAIYSESIHRLGLAAAEAWGLSPQLVTAHEFLDRPWDCEEAYVPVCCLHAAIAIVRRHGLAVDTWAEEHDTLPDVMDEVDLDPIEAEVLMDLVRERVLQVSEPKSV